MAEILLPATDDTPAAQLQAGVWHNNPVFVQALGMCPTLAVTNTTRNALAMGLATASVLIASSVVVSAIRGFIPRQVRLAAFVLVIATFVTVADYLIEAVDIELHRALGPFIALIVANCMILGRVEAYAWRHPVRRSAMDALAMGTGFAAALLALGAVRELLGQGALFGLSVAGPGFEPWVVMLLPGGGFFALAALVLLYRWFALRTTARREHVVERSE
jgi:Na+-translocating ferredoxin:NAD+ oxidoreductase subunit E